MTTTRLKIEGMHCDGCAHRVKRVLEREPGVQEADVSYTGGEARVTYDALAVTTGRLEQAIEKAGYVARVGV